MTRSQPTPSASDLTRSLEAHLEAWAGRPVGPGRPHAGALTRSTPAGGAQKLAMSKLVRLTALSGPEPERLSP